MRQTGKNVHKEQKIIDTILDWGLEFAETRTEFKTRVGLKSKTHMLRKHE